MKLKNLWKTWCLALGNKASDSDFESDMVAIVRTILIITTITAEIFLCANVIHHW